MNEDGQSDWFEDYAESAEEPQVEEYDVTVTPNDFNVMSLYSFMESGAIRIPGFQRNFVWDLGRASKLIESLLLGLPVPQLFLYEEARNKFLVIDGQQRLMSIYYFIRQRFLPATCTSSRLLPCGQDRPLSRPRAGIQGHLQIGHG